MGLMHENPFEPEEMFFVLAYFVPVVIYALVWWKVRTSFQRTGQPAHDMRPRPVDFTKLVLAWLHAVLGMITRVVIYIYGIFVGIVLVGGNFFLVAAILVISTYGFLRFANDGDVLSPDSIHRQIWGNVGIALTIIVAVMFLVLGRIALFLLIGPFADFLPH